MDIDYSSVLTALTALTGAVWLLDVRWLRARRERAAPDAGMPAPDAGMPVPWWVEYSIAFFPVLAIVLALRSFLFEPFQIPSSSMVPTLAVGDFVLVDKYSYGLRLPVLRSRIVPLGSPRRGDVMVFFPPGDPRYFIKRVIGLPGDRIEYTDRVLRINGEAATRTRVTVPSDEREAGWQRHTETIGEREYTVREHPMAPRRPFSVTVQPRHYFLMGDNRDNSRDSRVWGQVPEANIVGRAVAIWLHWDAFFSWPSLARNAWIL